MPMWVYYMVGVCIAAYGIGFIAAWAVDEWKRQRDSD
jgi:hypothetical protein